MNTKKTIPFKNVVFSKQMCYNEGGMIYIERKEAKVEGFCSFASSHGILSFGRCLPNRQAF